MGDALMLVGLLVAVGGPLLALGSLWVLSKRVLTPLLRTRWPSANGNRVFGGLVAIVATVFGLSWIPGKLEYDRACMAEALPRVMHTTKVDGFFQERLYAFEVLRHLERGFLWVETTDPYRSGRLLRYFRDPTGNLAADTLAAPSAAFGVSVQLDQIGWGVHATRKRVFRMADASDVATAAEIVYSGGPLSALAGAWLMESCPDIRTPRGGEAFQLFYDLEARVLRDTITEDGGAGAGGSQIP